MKQHALLRSRLRRHTGRSLIPTILLTVAAVAIGAAAMYVITVRNPVRETEEQTRARFMQMSGMDKPVKNKLADRFADVDSDLVADAPADASKLVDPPKLVFCYVAQEDPTEYQKLWQPFCDHLAKATGKPVEYALLYSSEDQLKALRDGKLHVTGFNSGSVPIAVNACGFVPVARVPTGDASGTHIEIIVPSNSTIRSVDDFKDRKYMLALVEPNSNTGYKAPIVLLRDDKGILPEREYLFRTTGSHEASIEGIVSKQFDAAAVSADMLAREEAKEKITKMDYRSIFKSESFPTAAVGYAYNLRPDLAAKVREAILSFDFKGTSLDSEFAPAVQTKFIPVSYKNDWALIRRIDDASGQAHTLLDGASPTTAPAATQQAAGG